MYWVEAETPEVGEGYGDDPCSWPQIIAALDEQLAELPSDQRQDLAEFIELIEGIASLETRPKS